MRYEAFEDVPVWKDGIELTKKVFLATEDKAFRYQGDLANQIQRAALSVPNNIAEGFERGTTPELITFLYYAKGSAGEVRSICHVIMALDRFAHLQTEISHLQTLAASISRQLSGWTRSLQDSDIKGVRHLTESSQKEYHSKKEGEAFMTQLRRQHEERLAKLVEERKRNLPE